MPSLTVNMSNCVNYSVGNQSGLWTNPGNTLTTNGTYATKYFLTDFGQGTGVVDVSAYLKITGSVTQPASSSGAYSLSYKGAVVNVVARAPNSDSVTPYYYSVKLIDYTGLTGEDRGSIYKEVPAQFSFQTQTLGGQSDNWGTNLSQVSGVAVSIGLHSILGKGTDVDVDSISLTIYYDYDVLSYTPPDPYNGNRGFKSQIFDSKLFSGPIFNIGGVQDRCQNT